jgi:hypothetical protein
MMNDLLKLLPQLLRQAGEQEEAREQLIFAGWVAAAGSNLSRVTAPVRLERKTLIVAVSDATWKSQLKRMSGHVLFKLNSLLGAPVVTSIEFIINPAAIRQEPQPPREITFTAPDRQALALRDSAERIPDQDMREAFLRAAGKCLERRAK